MFLDEENLKRMISLPRLSDSNKASALVGILRSAFSTSICQENVRSERRVTKGLESGEGGGRKTR